MVVVAVLVHRSDERENLIFIFLRISPPKTDFFTIFSIFSKKFGLFFYYNHAILYTTLSHTLASEQIFRYWS